MLLAVLFIQSLLTVINNTQKPANMMLNLLAEPDAYHPAEAKIQFNASKKGDSIKWAARPHEDLKNYAFGLSPVNGAAVNFECMNEGDVLYISKKDGTSATISIYRLNTFGANVPGTENKIADCSCFGSACQWSIASA